MEASPGSPLAIIGSVLSMILAFELMVKPVKCFTHPYPRTEYFTDPTEYGREQSYLNCNDVRRQFAEGYIQLSEFMERIRSCGEQVPSRFERTRPLYGEAERNSLQQVNQQTDQRLMYGIDSPIPIENGVSNILPAASSPFEQSVDFPMYPEHGIQPQSTTSKRMEGEVVKKSHIASNGNVRDVLLTSQNNGIYPAVLPLPINKRDNQILPGSNKYKVTQSMGSLLLNRATPSTRLTLANKVKNAKTLNILPERQKQSVLLPESLPIRKGYAPTQSLTDSASDNPYSYDDETKRTDVLNQRRTINDIIHQIKTDLRDNKDGTDDRYGGGEGIDTNKYAGKFGISDADLLGLTYNDMIELGMKDDVSFMEAGPSNDAKAVAIGDLDSTVPANVVREAIAKVQAADDLRKGRQSLRSSGRQLVLQNLNLANKAMPANELMLGGLDHHGDLGRLNANEKRSMLGQVIVDPEKPSTNSNDNYVPIFSTKDNVSDGQEIRSTFPVSGASDEITAENLATIFNEIDDDSVEAPTKDNEGKKDVIPGSSNVITSTEFGQESAARGSSPRTLETPFHGDDPFANYVQELRRASMPLENGAVSIDTPPEQKSQEIEGTRPIEAQGQVKKSDVKREPPRRFNLASLHFGLHNGNLVE